MDAEALPPATTTEELDPDADRPTDSSRLPALPASASPNVTVTSPDKPLVDTPERTVTEPLSAPPLPETMLTEPDSSLLAPVLGRVSPDTASRPVASALPRLRVPDCSPLPVSTEMLPSVACNAPARTEM